MKKAKIILTAIAVFAVIGGALAFKAKKFNLHVFYRTTGTTGLCTVTTFTTLTTIGGTIPQTTYYTTPVNVRPCPVTSVIANP